MVESSNMNKSFLKFFFYFFKMSGLATFKFIYKPLSMDQRIYCITSESKMGISYNVFLILVVIFTGIPGIRHAIKTNYLNIFKDELALVASIDISLQLCTVTTLATFCIKQKKMISIINKLNNVIELSTEISSNDCCRNNSSITRRAAFCIINTIIIITIFSFSTVSFQNVPVMLYLIARYLDLFIITSVFLQYSIILEYMRNIFKFINDEFFNLTRPSISLSKICNNEVIQSTKIDKLMRMYDLLSEISEEVADFYSRTMMWCIFNNFFSLFVSLYCNIVRLSRLKILARGIIIDINNIYFNIIRLPILVISVSSTVKEVMFCFLLFYF